MYSKIVDEYLTNYQNAVAGTVLDDANTIEQMKQETLKSLEEQKMCIRDSSQTYCTNREKRS